MGLARFKSRPASLPPYVTARRGGREGDVLATRLPDGRRKLRLVRALHILHSRQHTLTTTHHAGTGRFRRACSSCSAPTQQSARCLPGALRPARFMTRSRQLAWLAFIGCGPIRTVSSKKTAAKELWCHETHASLFPPAPSMPWFRRPKAPILLKSLLPRQHRVQHRVCIPGI